jgi:hypothetical protein
MPAGATSASLTSPGQRTAETELESDQRRRLEKEGGIGIAAERAGESCAPGPDLAREGDDGQPRVALSWDRG